MLQSLNVTYPNVNSNLAADSTPTVTGYALALGKASASERAFTAANLALGRLALIEPRVTQAARLARVCEPYVEAAIEVLLSSEPELETSFVTARFRYSRPPCSRSTRGPRSPRSS
jgi:hypothetical protein